MTVNDENKDPCEEYLRRFRGVEPPRELRARVLEKTGRARSRDRWLPAAAALLLVLLTVLNVHLEKRVQMLANGGTLREAGLAREHVPPELVEPFGSLSLRLRLAVRRPPGGGEQSWLKLRAAIERTEG